MIKFETGEFKPKRNLEQFLADSWNFGCFDEDANGSNGDEHLLTEARTAGFETNLEYWATKAFNETGTTEDAIKAFADSFFNSWTPYCYEWEFTIKTLSNRNYLLIFAAYHKD